MLRFPIIFHIEYLLPNLEFIKSNRCQIRTVNIKALLFFKVPILFCASFAMNTLELSKVQLASMYVGVITGFAKDTEPTISGIASTLRKTLKLTSWYY